MRATLTKTEIAALKTACREYAEARSGGYAHLKYHRQCRYVEGFVAVPLAGISRAAKVRVYSDGWLYAMDVDSQTISSDYLPACDFLAPIGSPS